MANYNIEFVDIKANEMNYFPGKLTYNEALEKMRNGVIFVERMEIAEDEGGGCAYMFISFIGTIDIDLGTLGADFGDGGVQFGAESADSPLIADLRS